MDTGAIICWLHHQQLDAVMLLCCMRIRHTTLTFIDIHERLITPIAPTYAVFHTPRTSSVGWFDALYVVTSLQCASWVQGSWTMPVQDLIN